jgi:hypothetical protein
MSDMKLIMERWEGFIVETKTEQEAAGHRTWGELNLAIEAAKEMAEGAMTAARKKELLKILGTVGFALAGTLATGGLGALVATVGVGATVGSAVADMFRTYARQPDVETKDNPLLALFNLDDGFEELIDDKLEDAFVKYMAPRIEKMASEAPNKPIEDMDKVINLWLAQQDLKGSKGNVAAKVGGP